MKTAVISDFQKYIDVNLPIIYINDFVWMNLLERLLVKMQKYLSGIRQLERQIFIRKLQEETEQSPSLTFLDENTH